MKKRVTFWGLILGSLVSMPQAQAANLFSPVSNWIKLTSVQQENSETVIRAQNAVGVSTTSFSEAIAQPEADNFVQCDSCEQSCWGIGGGIEGGVEAWGDAGDGDEGQNFGFRYGVNLGAAHQGSRYGIQMGLSHGLFDLSGREDGAEDYKAQQQFISTIGVFRRSNVSCDERISAGIVWDYMHDNNYGEDGFAFDLNQLRGQAGYATNHCNEIGVWFTFNIDDDIIDANADDNGPYAVRAQDQIALYWDHAWELGARTRILLGWADGRGDIVFGARGTVPLNDRVALYGNLHFIPASASSGDNNPPGTNGYAEDLWSIGTGVVWTFGCGGARQCDISGRYADPLLPLATNGTFSKVTPANVQ